MTFNVLGYIKKFQHEPSKDDIRNVRPDRELAWNREHVRRPTTKTTLESKTTLKQIKQRQPKRTRERRNRSSILR